MPDPRRHWAQGAASDGAVLLAPLLPKAACRFSMLRANSESRAVLLASHPTSH